jgi:hypothetical protein
MFLHGGFATKSYVTPSIRRAISPAILTKELIQGPKNARLQGRWTPGDYSECRAGDYFVSDDMTSNVLCWCEWPNAQGWRIGQAQILPVMDVRSLRWLNVRVIIRDGGQYNAQDDIWGLFGDTFEAYGLPHEGFVLEGGHWQSGAVQGVRTGLDADTRIGGLESLGLRNVRSFDPRSKIIETMFNTFQRHMDRMPGWAGRDQRTQMGEVIKKRVSLLRAKYPAHHPREFFPHISQLADQVKAAMETQNHERQDGKLLRGLSPLELWAEHAPQLRSIPDGAKWLYRSAVNVSKVTSNGVRITRGSGPKMEVYYYDAPEILVPRQGQNVIVHWNDSSPESDACLRDAKTRAFIGLAKYVKPLARFTATNTELAGESRRKQAALHYARTEMRAMQPDLVRETVPIPVGAGAVDFGDKLAEAARQPVEAMAGGRYAALDNAAPASGLAGVSLAGRPKQIRGQTKMIRAALESFGGQAFTLQELRAKVPEAIRPRVSSQLSLLKAAGELVRFKPAEGKPQFQVVRPGVRAAAAGTPQPGNLAANADAPTTYILAPARAD